MINNHCYHTVEPLNYEIGSVHKKWIVTYKNSHLILLSFDFFGSDLILLVIQSGLKALVSFFD